MTDPDLAVAAEVATEFEAAALVAVLKEAGIDAAVSRNAPSWTGQMSISPTATGASVLVRDEDLERAEDALAAHAQASVDLDWNEVDVGERVDDLPLTEVGRMPVLARIAFAAALVLIVLAAIGALLGIF